MTDTANGPKIGISVSNFDNATLRRVRQLGITIVHSSGGAGSSDSNFGREKQLPWTEEVLGGQVRALEAHGIKLGIKMITGFPNAIYGRPGRDEEIENVIESIKIAGRLGIPVVEYNWYAHRIIEGYYYVEGRGGSEYHAFDYEKIKDLPPLPNEGAHSADAMWDNITYFLKAIIPAAEEAGVRMALHPNDPPAPISRGSEQIMGSIYGWKKLVGLIDSTANGITFDCGVTREMGGDPVDIARYFGGLDRINHVHWRNVITDIPNEKYTEVFLDEGEVDMLGVMKELVRQGYPRMIYPEHPPRMDHDNEFPVDGFGGGYTGFAYTVGYARATLQAALAGS
ncbi:MAG: mannonate dehydratase [Chloroflexi bacterium]|nr:mannonate dehydratase [Chloroflexota bacterium]